MGVSHNRFGWADYNLVAILPDGRRLRAVRTFESAYRSTVEVLVCQLNDLLEVREGSVILEMPTHIANHRSRLFPKVVLASIAALLCFSCVAGVLTLLVKFAEGID